MVELVEQLKAIVGNRQVLIGERQTAAYRQPFRGQNGPALAVVKPSSLLQMWQVLQVAVKAELVIVMQAANTSLTGGSTPVDLGSRQSIIINTQKLSSLHYLDKQRQIIALPGTSLFDVENKLKKLGRSPHSVIGSSCFGASVVGGICNNSGGALVNRGPAYTELSIFAKLTEQGELILVNHLDIELGETPEEILPRLEAGRFEQGDILNTQRQASASDYQDKVRQISENSPARYNADPQKLYEASGSSGKIAVFAVRVDSFEAPASQRLTLVGAKSPQAFTALRKQILTKSKTLPVSAEYLHADTVQLGVDYGRDTIRLIQWLGTQHLPLFFRLKRKVDRLFDSLGLGRFSPSERILQVLGRLTVNPMSKPMRQWLEDKQHVLLITSNQSLSEQNHITELCEQHPDLTFFDCDNAQAQQIALVRYAAAAATMRYAQLNTNEVEGVIALDIALRRNDDNWLETLPPEIQSDLVAAHYYGHFLCHVMHQDYLVKKGVDLADMKQRLLAFTDSRGAIYPAEHNVGHEYEAAATLQQHYKQLDPTNSFNAGIGKMSREKHYGCKSGCKHPN